MFENCRMFRSISKFYAYTLTIKVEVEFRYGLVTAILIVNFGVMDALVTQKGLGPTEIGVTSF
jgi:hypothetical protein